ncbi:hypothetical protein ACS5PN_06475 [Roseateles sp. NT4]|uniref:hypothetical protein n=1 Tax=Roseateles sp. NT4 TaxID=3453715 RepID=UPI003EEFF59B
MSLSASQRRRVALAALALVGAYKLTQPAHASGLPRPAANSPQVAAPKHRATEPLRLDPPTRLARPA